MTGRKYFQMTYRTMDKYLNYLKNAPNSIVKTTQNKNSTKNPVRKWAKVMNRHFTEENIQMSSKVKNFFSVPRH